MDTPFVLSFHVQHVNVPPGNDSRIRLFENYQVRVTLSHTIADIFELIWINSENYFLKPVFLKMSYNGASVDSHQQLCDILQTPEVPFVGSSAVNGAFILTINYLLLDSSAVPRRDPDTPLFDIVVKVPGQTSSQLYRESLSTTIGVLRDQISESAIIKRNRKEFKLVLQSSGRICDARSQVLSDILQLDVTPLHAVVFQVVQNEAPRTSRRFHIQLNSTVEVLQEGNNLFEVTTETLIHDFKHDIISRMDHLSVRRTFFDQIKLYYATQLIDSNNAKLYDIMLLDDSILQDNGNIILMDLEVSEHNGIRGIFSRQFWRDLQSPNRFEFLPNRNNDLRRTPRNYSADANVEAHESMSQNTPMEDDSHYVNLVRPPRIVLENGLEWNMTGRTFEEILTAATTGSNSQRNFLVQQSDLLLQEQYEFSLEIEGGIRKVLLNTSQCIIVDDPSHAPYVLVSPAGLAKLNGGFTQGTSSFPQGLVQKTQVIRDDCHTPIESLFLGEGSNVTNNRDVRVDPFLNSANRAVDQRPVAPSQRPAPQRPAPQQAVPQQRNAIPRGPSPMAMAREVLRNWVAQYGPTISKVIFFLYIFGFYDDVAYLYQLGVVKYVIAILATYFILTRGQHIGDWIERNVVPDAEDAAVRAQYSITLAICKGLRLMLSVMSFTTGLFMENIFQQVVHRRREYEYIARQELNTDSVWFYFTGLINTVSSDFMMMLLSMLPALEARMEQAIEVWRAKEMESFENDIEELQALLVELISDVLPDESPFDVILQLTGMPWDLIVELQEEDSDTGDEETQIGSDSDIEYYEKLLEYYRDLHSLLRAYKSGTAPSPRESNVQERGGEEENERTFTVGGD